MDLRLVFLLLLVACKGPEKADMPEMATREEVLEAFAERDAAISDIVKVIEKLPDYQKQKLKESKGK